MEPVETTTVKMMNGKCKAIIQFPGGKQLVIEQNEQERVDVTVPEKCKWVDIFNDD